MAKRDPRVDAYIAQSAGFARPILTHLRRVVHTACPGVEETIKWGFPHFMYQGMLCSMAAFTAHCAFGFWKGRLIAGVGAPEAMGHFGKIVSLDDLPSTARLTRYIKQAMKLNEAGVTSPTRGRPRPRRPVVVPADLRRALGKHAKARATFEGLSPSGRRDYVQWITEARTDATRVRRLATTLEWLAEGKSRNWKYLDC